MRAERISDVRMKTQEGYPVHPENPVVVHSDHKLLHAITKKALDIAPKRLQIC